MPDNEKVNDLTDEYRDRGFVVIKDALSQEQVENLIDAVRRSTEVYPEEWYSLKESALEAVNLLTKMSDFDQVIEHPKVLGILRIILGEDVTFEEFHLMIRSPSTHLEPARGWHRDTFREYHKRQEIDSVKVMYYLVDVTENDDCFCIVPCTHDRLIDLRPEDTFPEETDVTGPAGTAVIFHSACIHSAKLKQNSAQRITLSPIYSQAGKPRVSEYTEIPKRLYDKRDPSLPPQLYSKWDSKDVLSGTGRIPDDIDGSLPIGDIIREVQRRAKAKSEGNHQ